MQEVWKDVVGYEGFYQVSNLGNVRSVTRIVKTKRGQKLLHGMPIRASKSHSTKYLYVNLNRDGKLRRCTIHRLVAEAFIPNPNNLPQVNHKDEIRDNNEVSNLEWCTNVYNSNYGTKNERMSRIKKLQNCGEKNPFYGKHHTDAVRQRLSERLIGCVRINDGVINKTIYKYELETYLNLGWKKGMIKNYEHK